MLIYSSSLTQSNTPALPLVVKLVGQQIAAVQARAEPGLVGITAS